MTIINQNLFSELSSSISEIGNIFASSFALIFQRLEVEPPHVHAHPYDPEMFDPLGKIVAFIILYYVGRYGFLIVWRITDTIIEDFLICFNHSINLVAIFALPIIGFVTSLFAMNYVSIVLALVLSILGLKVGGTTFFLIVNLLIFLLTSIIITWLSGAIISATSQKYKGFQGLCLGALFIFTWVLYEFVTGFHQNNPLWIDLLLGHSESIPSWVNIAEYVEYACILFFAFVGSRSSDSTLVGLLFGLKQTTS